MAKRTTYVFLFLSVLLMVSIIYSKFLLSVAMIGFLVLTFFDRSGNYKWWKDKGFAMVTLFFFLFVLSIINSSNYNDWAHHVKMRLPFLVLPLAFYKLPKINRRTYYFLHLVMIIIIFISSIPVLYHIIFSFDDVYADIARGTPVDTPVHHIKYSIFIAYSILSGMIMLVNKIRLKYFWEKHLLAIITIYLFVFIHVLAVRTGIFALYASLFILGIAFIWKKSNIQLVPAFVFLFLVLPFLAYNFIPSLNKRVQYMIYDLKEYSRDGGDNYSDSDRINSLIIGWELFKENPILGTGIGDFKDDCTLKYAEKFGSDKTVLYPHNQYLFILAATGILGIIVFIIALWGPVFVNKNYQDELLLTLVLLVSIGFMVDNILERSFSAGFFAYFLCLGLNYLKSEPTSKA